MIGSFTAINQGVALGACSEQDAQRAYFDMRNAVPQSQDGTPLSALAEQLVRVSEVRKRLAGLVERLVGPQAPATEPGESLLRYGGVIGALEGEAQTLRRTIDAIHRDLVTIEEALR